MSEDKEKKGGSGCLLKCFSLLIVASLIGVLSFVWLGKEGMNTVKETLVGMVRTFQPQVVINNFTEWCELQVKGNDGNILEVATATSKENFSRESNIEFQGRPLAQKVINISVPATYRFHIDLKGDWVIEDDGSRLVVTAPPIKPSLPVAFDSGKIERKTTKGGWIPTVGTMENLEKTVTEGLAVRAKDPETIDKVKEDARLSIAKFLQTWLIGEDAWAKGKFEELVVAFEGEDPETLAPCLTVGEVEEPVLN